MALTLPSQIKVLVLIWDQRMRGDIEEQTLVFVH